MLTKEELPECPVATTVQLIGNKWKLLIIRNLLAEPQRFSQLKNSIDGISQKVLADNLKSLVDDGLVNRENFAEIPPKVVYSLSELGDSLRPIIEEMRVWGANYKQLKNK
jgi:DNA-binding HxlR family transcriptional regulator